MKIFIFTMFLIHAGMLANTLYSKRSNTECLLVYTSSILRIIGAVSVMIAMVLPAYMLHCLAVASVMVAGAGVLSWRSMRCRKFCFISKREYGKGKCHE